MSKFNFYFIALASLSILFSCNKSDDDIEEVPLRSYSDQYATDLATIETFLQKHYIKEIVNNPGGVDDQDIIFGEIDTTSPLQQKLADSPLLDFIFVEKNDIPYKVYFLRLREGVGESPSRVDKVLTAYEGSYLAPQTKEFTFDGIVNPAYATASANVFETVQVPSNYLALHSTIVGFTEVFPHFKPGTVGPSNPGSPTSYLDFGAGVMFIPSGLGYFNYATPTIPSYSPLMFKFKFYNMERDDYDGDGILSVNEDIDGDGHFDNDDTDGDGVPNYLDADDDGDGYNTKVETRYITNDEFHTVKNYVYGANADDPGTPDVNEMIGIPRAFTGSVDPVSQLVMPNLEGTDFTDPARLRRHLDPSARPPYYDYNP